MNKVFLIGNIASDVEMRTTQSGISTCSFRLAVTRRFANQQGQREADFFQIVAWRSTAEFIHRYFLKGSRIAVEGSIQNRSYEAQDGSKRYVTEIIADNAEFAGSVQDGRREAPAAPSPGSQPKPQQPPMQLNMHDVELTEVEDDDLPF